LAGIARADVGTALKALALRLPQPLELLLQAVQLVICATLQRDKAGAGMLDRAEQFIQLEVQGARITILGALNQKHDEKHHDGRPGINHQLPGVREVKIRPAQAPDQDDPHSRQKGPRGPHDLGRAIRQFPESLADVCVGGQMQVVTTPFRAHPAAPLRDETDGVHLDQCAAFLSRLQPATSEPRALAS